MRLRSLLVLVLTLLVSPLAFAEEAADGFAQQRSVITKLHVARGEVATGQWLRAEDICVT